MFYRTAQIMSFSFTDRDYGTVYTYMYIYTCSANLQQNMSVCTYVHPFVVCLCTMQLTVDYGVNAGKETKAFGRGKGASDY